MCSSSDIEGEPQSGKRLKMDAQTKADMQELFKTKLVNVATKEQIERVVTNIEANSKKIKANEAQIHKQGVEFNKQSVELKNIRGSIQRLEAEATEGRRGLDKRIGDAVARAVAGSASEGSGLSAAARREERRFQEFDKARKSLRVWPIDGGNDLKIREGIEDFMMTALLIDSFSQEWIEHVERAPPMASGSAHDEVIIRFATRQKRDEVFGKRTLLRTYVDANRKPTSGIRIQVPNHLEPTFKLLEAYGYDLRNAHGRELRRYIKFDDFERDLFLQVKFPNVDEWVDITPTEARLSRTRKNNRRVASAREFLSPEMSQTVRRTSSLGDNDDAASSLPPSGADAGAMETDAVDQTVTRQTWRPVGARR